MQVLTVGEIRKAIRNLPDDAEVSLSFDDQEDETIGQAVIDMVPSRAWRDVRNGALVIDVTSSDALEQQS